MKISISTLRKYLEDNKDATSIDLSSKSIDDEGIVIISNF